jgi:hypothetical protein
MTILNQKFDIVSRDPHPNAQAGLMVILDVAGALGPYGVGAPGTGTPVPGSIVVGSIVVMNTSGQAVLADNANALTNAPQMFYTTVDGDQDYDGAFVHRITCIQGGMEIVTELFVPDSYLPGNMLTCGDSSGLPTVDYSGYFRKATSGEQIYGMVGSDGYNAVEATLHIIIPQGISPAKP